MALIEDRYKKARMKGSGHERLFGVPQLARLTSATHAAIIASGNELEKLILDQASTLEDVDEYLNLEDVPQGTFIVPKKQIKRSVVLNTPQTEPDFLIFKRDANRFNCYVIELKDGDQFDTKKSAGEWRSLNDFMNHIARLVQFRTSSHVCFFHADTREEVVDGFKKKIGLEDALTGRELCKIIDVDYESILEHRREHQPKNFDFFVREFLSIPEVQEKIREIKSLP